MFFRSNFWPTCWSWKQPYELTRHRHYDTPCSMDHLKTTHPVALLIDEIIRLAPRIKTIFSAGNANTGLSMTDLTVLAAVVAASREPTVPQIGRSLGYARQVIQASVNRMLEKGLIETTPNPDHKRAPLLRPTQRGIEAKQYVDKVARSGMDALLSILDADDCIRLWRELHDLRGKIEAYLRETNSAEPGRKFDPFCKEILLRADYSLSE